MNIVGISALDKESTVTVVRDGQIVAAVSEERLTRVKQAGGFPGRSLEAALKLSGLGAGQIDVVAYPFFEAGEEFHLAARSALADLGRWSKKLARRGLSHTLRHYAVLSRTVLRHIPQRLTEGDRQLTEGLLACGFSGTLRRYDHQYCHAVSAYYTSGFDRALVVTLDWYGSGKAGSIYLGEGGRLRLVETILFPDSLGILYASVTSALGFVPDRHEGKVVGLAAYGDPSKLTPAVMARFLEDTRRYEFLDAMDSTSTRRLAQAHSREDVAAAYQQALEIVVLRHVRCCIRSLHVPHVAVAGGVFANVKLNQRIAALPEVEGLFVHPAMSDMGTGTGAALAAALEGGDLSAPQPLASVFLGPAYTDQEMEQALAQAGARYLLEPEMPARVAALVAQGKLVARFTGRMEYGPRALGNRSVLASTSDPAITEILNAKLRRSEFMPFAPATLHTAANRCYDGAEKVSHTAQFMTVCLPVTAWMRQASPAAVHVDGTARPQLVSAESNPDLYQILRETERLTGVPSVINTSFNIHEEPIVCSPEDAIRAFSEAGLDALAIGNFLVVR
jgi:carbamoyltransferase